MQHLYPVTLSVIYPELSSINFLNEGGRPEITFVAYNLSSLLPHRQYDPLACEGVVRRRPAASGDPPTSSVSAS